MSEEAKAFYEQFARDFAAMRQQTPAAVSGFGALFGAVMKDGALSLKHKELIALAIGLALRCEPCILLHVKKCVEAGATRAEVLDAAGVAVMMQGGPSYTHIPNVIAALDACGA